MSQKQIYKSTDIETWKSTDSYQSLGKFILYLCDSASEMPFKILPEKSEIILKLEQLLDEINKACDDTPLRNYAARFGNDAFRNFVEKVKKFSPSLLVEFFEITALEAEQLTDYLCDSLGHYNRLDYGTGHELCFLIFIYLLYKLQKLDFNDTLNCIFTVFWGYFKLVSKVQKKFNLEPAGSHGVWGVDDFHHLSFLLGAAQLQHSGYKPSDTCKSEVRKGEAESCIFFWAVQEILDVKKAELSECSPYIFDLTKLRNFKLVRNSLETAYFKEVLDQFVVVQHLLFCELFPWDPKI